ncbi:MAG: hypothetical protein EHM89_04525 [Acidobacteria bacterium]|nr:MAG: hypothetical protein EHM89_04525 [Acidobacteriota bacterium]
MIRILFAIGVMTVAAVLSPATQAQTKGDQLEITAFAVNMSNIATGANAVVDIRVNQWSTEEERERLITTMLEKGQDALLRELTRTPVKGRFRIPGIQGPDPHQLRLGHDLHYAWQTPLPDGGRRIVIATDRYIGFREAANQPRTTDYPFTLIEIRVNKEGKGEGKMAVATKITFDKKKQQIELENYSTEPVRLNNLQMKVKS